MSYSGSFRRVLSAACLGLTGFLTVLGCDGAAVPLDSTRAAEFRKASFGPHEESAALPDYVKVNQERPQEQKLLARLLLEPGHIFEIYQDQDLIYYTESAPAGVQPFPFTEREKSELTPKSIVKRIAPELPIPLGVELAEVQFQKQVQVGNCTEHSDGLIHCPRSAPPHSEAEKTEPQFASGAAVALDGGTSIAVQAQSELGGAIGENEQASNIGGGAIRPAIKNTNTGTYTGCAWDWFRVNKCKDPPWNGVDWTGCEADRAWAFIYADAAFDSATVCTVSGAINFEYYENGNLSGSWYTTESNWRSVWKGPRTHCEYHWYCGPAVLCDCHAYYYPVHYNIPTYPNGPVGSFHFTWAMDIQ